MIDPMTDVLRALFLIGVCVAIGVGIVLEGLDRRTIGEQARREPTSTTRDLTTTDEAVELYGTAESHPDHPPLEAPFSDDECLYRRWAVEEKQPLGERSRWRTLDEGADCVPFSLRDEHGAVEVDLEGFDTVFLDAEQEPGLSSRFGTPAAAKAFVEEHVDADATDAGLLSRPRRFEQTLLKPGDEVYVYGKPTRADDEFFDRVVVTGFDDESEHEGVISDYSPRRLRRQRIAGWLAIGYGAVFTATGTVGVVAPLLDLAVASLALLTFAGVAGAGVLYLVVDYVWRAGKRVYYSTVAS